MGKKVSTFGSVGGREGVWEGGSVGGRRCGSDGIGISGVHKFTPIIRPPKPQNPKTPKPLPSSRQLTRHAKIETEDPLTELSRSLTGQGLFQIPPADLVQVVGFVESALEKLFAPLGGFH